MPQAMIYVFKEPRNWKNKAAESVSMMYENQEQINRQLRLKIEEKDVYHVTAFNTYGNLIAEIYKSEGSNGKAIWKVTTRGIPGGYAISFLGICSVSGALI